MCIKYPYQNALDAELVQVKINKVNNIVMKGGRVEDVINLMHIVQEQEYRKYKHKRNKDMCCITKEKFQQYEDVRINGMINMWNAGNVNTVTGLTIEEIREIRYNYSTYKEKYQ